VVAPLDEHRLASKAADGLRHLDSDRPGAEDEQSARDGFHAGDFAVRPDSIQLMKTRDRRNDRIGAGSEDDVLRRIAGAVHFHDTLARETSMASLEIDAVLGEPAFLPGIGVVRDHEVTPRERGFSVDRRVRGGLVCGARGLTRTQ